MIRLVFINTLASYRDREEALDLLFSSLYSRFLWLWASEYLRVVAPVEFRHGRNHTRADRNMNWATFAAVYLCQEAKRRLVLQLKAMKLTSAQDTGGTAAENKGHKNHHASSAKVEGEILPIRTWLTQRKNGRSV